MITVLKNLDKKICENQDFLYEKLNNYSKSHPILGRFCAIPLAVLDVACESCKLPLKVLQALAATAISLVGAAFSKKDNLKLALRAFELSLQQTASIPVTMVFAPAKIVFQICSSMIAPESVLPFYKVPEFDSSKT